MSDTNTKPLQVAIIGLGKMGVMHATMCHAVEGVEVAALMDLDNGLCKQTLSMGIDAPSFNSIEKMFAEGPPLDAVLIATPQFTHRAVGIQCLEQGLHVFCEKPLAHSLDDAQAMADAAGKHGEKITAIGFMKGHYPLWLEAARRMSEGWIGTPRRFRASVALSQVFSPKKGWTFTKEKAGGGILINSGIHLIQFLHTLFGSALQVHALARPMHSNVEDTMTALLEFSSGVFGSYDASWSLPGYPTEGTQIMIEGDDGTMEITDDWLRTHHLTGEGQAPKGWSESHRAEFDHAKFTLSPDYGGEGYFNQVEDFAHAIREKSAARFDWQHGLEIQQIIDCIYRSIESGQIEQISKAGKASA